MFDEICKDCKAKDSIIEDYEAGMLVCNNCGLVFKERIIVDEIEERTNDENHLRRVDLPERPETVNDSHNVLIIREFGKTKVVKTYSKKDKITKNNGRIYKFLSKYGIMPSIIAHIKKMYSGLAKKQNMQGKNFNHIIIAMYFQACRDLNQAKTLKEISKMFNVPERKIKKAFKGIKYDLEYNCDKDEKNTENKFAEIEKNYISEYFGVNEAKFGAKMLAFEIVQNINDQGILEGKAPKTIAGLALLLSYRLLNDNDDNSNEFSSYFSKKATLMKYFEEIKDSLNQIIPVKYSDNIEELKNSLI